MKLIQKHKLRTHIIISDLSLDRLQAFNLGFTQTCFGQNEQPAAGKMWFTLDSTLGTNVVTCHHASVLEAKTLSGQVASQKNSLKICHFKVIFAWSLKLARTT